MAEQREGYKTLSREELEQLGEALAAVALAAWVIAKQFSGFSNGEVTNMWRTRKVRVAALALVAIAIAVFVYGMPAELALEEAA